MAETPPQGSLLSNFISGGSTGGFPNPGDNSPKKKRDEIPAYTYNRFLRKWVPTEIKGDEASQVGGQIAGAGLKQVDSFIGGLRDGLIGEGVLKRFGGEDKVVAAAYDYVQKAAAETGNQQLLNDLDIATPEKFSQKYIPFMRARQEEENAQRRSKGEKEVSGFGNYQVQTRSTVLLNPLSSAKEVSKQALAINTKNLLDGIGIDQDHPELSFFTKQEISHYSPQFIKRLSEERVALGNLSQSAVLSLKKVLAEYESDRKKPDEQRTGALSKIEKAVKDRVYHKILLGRLVSGISKFYKGLDHATKNPIGFAFSNLIVKPISNFVLGERTIRGRRIGFNLGKKLSKWLEGQGFLGKTVGKAGQIIGQGVGNAFRNLLSKASTGVGKLIGRGISKAIGFLVKNVVATAAKFAAAALVSAVGAITGPILIAVGATIGIVVVGVLLVMMVFIPLFSALNPPASAAPLDLAISVVPTSPVINVGPNETVSGTIQVTANKAAQNLSVRANFDTNYAVESISGGADSAIIGAVITWPKTPYPTVNAGQSVTFSFSAKTAASMTTTTAAVVRITATSSTSSASANFSVNGSGIPGFDDNVPFGWPVNGTITQSLHSDFGGRFDLVSKGTAVDIGGNNNARICSTMNGRVVATDDGSGGQGPLIVNDTSGFWARFNHMLFGSVAVKVGQQVTRGQFLGLVDTSGLATGPHLHYAIYSSTTNGRPGSGPGYGFYQYLPPGNIDSSGQIINSTVNNGITC